MSQDTLIPCIEQTSQFMALQLTAIRELHTIAKMPHQNGVGNKILNFRLFTFVSIVYSVTTVLAMLPECKKQSDFNFT